jgi:hypothetical protein
MLNSNNRVLTRMGAREISVEELEMVNGSGGPVVCTQMCTSVTSATGKQTITCDSECPPH